MTTAGEQTEAVPDNHVAPGFETFFRATYAPLVRDLAVAADDVEDAVQEAFVQAHLNWSKVAGFDDPRGWVRLVAVRKLLNRERRRSRGIKAIERLGVATDVRVESTLVPELTAEIRRLPVRQRIAVALFYLCDLPLTEVATTMGISTGAVKSTLAEGRKNLRLHLERDHDA